MGKLPTFSRLAGRSVGMDEMSGDGGGTILTPTTDLDVFRQAQLQALRMLSDQQSITNRAVEKMADAVGSMREDVAGLKAQNIREAVERLDAKLDAVQATNAAAIAQVRADVEHKFAERDQAQARRAENEAAHRQSVWVAITELKGKIVPLAAAGSAILAVVVSTLVKLAMDAGG